MNYENELCTFWIIEGIVPWSLYLLLDLLLNNVCGVWGCYSTRKGLYMRRILDFPILRAFKNPSKQEYYDGSTG